MLHIFSVAHILTCTSPMVHILMCCVYRQWRTSWYVAYIVSGAHPDMLYISSVAHILMCTSLRVAYISGTHPDMLHISPVAHSLMRNIYRERRTT
jgi:hypothetical protein